MKRHKSWVIRKDRLINLIYKSKIAVIKNVRSQEAIVKQISGADPVTEGEAGKLFEEYHERASQAGVRVLKRFCEARNIPEKFRPSANSKVKLHQHSQYKPVGRYDQILMFGAYLAYWNLRHSITASRRSLWRSVNRSTKIVNAFRLLGK